MFRFTFFSFNSNFHLLWLGWACLYFWLVVHQWIRILIGESFSALQLFLLFEIPAAYMPFEPMNGHLASDTIHEKCNGINFFWLNRFFSEFILFQQFFLSTYSFFLSRHIYYWMHAGRVIHLQRSFVMVIAVWFIFLLKYSFIQANFCVCPTHHHFYQWMMYGLEMVVQIDANHTSINLTTRQKSRLYLDLQFSITNFAIKIVATYADPIHPCITFCILWLFARK